MILLPISWRIFLFHSASTSVVILGFLETIRYMLESKPISISLLHLFQFIDIASRKLGPLFTSFVNLEFVIILISTVKTSHDSHPQNLYVFDSHILLSCAVCYIVICVNGIYSLFVSFRSFLFFIVLPRLYTPEEVSSVFNLLGKRFLRLSKKGVELNVMETLMGGHLLCTFLSVLNILVKNLSITNPHYLFLVHHKF